MGWQIRAWDVKKIRNQRTDSELGDLDDICKHITHSRACSWHFFHIWAAIQVRAWTFSQKRPCHWATRSAWQPQADTTFGSTVPLRSRARHSWAVTSQRLSRASHSCSNTVDWFCSKAPYWAGRVCFRDALQSGWGSHCLIFTSLLY